MFSLCLVTDKKQLRPGASLFGVVEQAEAGGVDAVILREKDPKTSAELLALAKKIKKSCGNAVFLINGRCDIAVAAGADGVHLSENSISPGAARKILGKSKLIGKSCHSLASAIKAYRAGADYIFLGPVYFTKSKARYGKPLGCEIIRKVVSLVSIPVIAIGGIKPANIKEALKAGAGGVALISGIFGAKNPKKAAEMYIKRAGG